MSMFKDQQFFVVWSPTGLKPPSIRHDTFQSAHIEAERLAKSMPGAEFFVLKAVSRTAAVGVRTDLLLETEPGVPF